MSNSSESMGLINVFVHKLALVESGDVGQGTKVWAYTHIMDGVHIGENCNVGEQCFIESGAVIGNNVTIKNGNMIWDGVIIEDGVFVGPSVHFTNDLHPRSPRLPYMQARYGSKGQWLVPTAVKFGASLGAGAVIIAGISIGEYAMVGAGSVVTKSIQPYRLAVGNPAKVIKTVCRCGQSLPLLLQDQIVACSVCGLLYMERDGSVIYLPQD